MKVILVVLTGILIGTAISSLPAKAQPDHQSATVYRTAIIDCNDSLAVGNNRGPAVLKDSNGDVGFSASKNAPDDTPWHVVAAYSYVLNSGTGGTVYTACVIQEEVPKP